DLACSLGTPIYATWSGVILAAARDSSRGKFVEIDHGHGLITSYMHASDVFVSKGQRIAKGQLIARVGATGKATGPHLHLQLELENRPIDPMRYIPALSRRFVAADEALEATTSTTPILVRIGPVLCAPTARAD